MSFPHPWPGGWWRMGDIVRQQEISTFALLETAARYREMFLRNMAIKASRQVQRGRRRRRTRCDPAPAARSGNGRQARLDADAASVEVHRATESFPSGRRVVEPGDFVIRLDQPSRAL